VVGVDASGVDIVDGDGNSSRLPTYTTMWAAGVEASPLAKELAAAAGAGTDGAGRIKVEPDLTLPGHPEVFVVGDMMALDRLPGVAEVAMQGGLHAANAIVRRLKDKPAVPFKYRDLGTAATIGRFRSVVDFKGLRLSGFPGWVIWAFVHLAFLSGFGNRLSTVFKWTRSFVVAAVPSVSSASCTPAAISASQPRCERRFSPSRSHCLSNFRPRGRARRLTRPTDGGSR
jgi:NADH:ubiquinone reductase (H+-translocating)